MQKKSPEFGSLVAVLTGFFLIILGVAVYAYEQASMALPTPGGVAFLVSVAEAYLLVVVAGLSLVGLGAWRAVGDRITAIRRKGLAPLSPGWIIPYVLSLGKYRRLFVASAIVYGLFYAVITSMIVYQPGVDFVNAYAATIPSLVVTPVPGTPLYTPVVTAYLTNHLGVLLIPLTIFLAVVVSVLVGVNVALAWFAFDSRARGASKGWVTGVGAVVGLFTGCPTCAGLFFANVLGGTGAVSFETLLGYYQPVFIILSLPVLLAAPYLTSRSLSKVFREGCVLLGRTPP
jgi:hypothetical protein